MGAAEDGPVHQTTVSPRLDSVNRSASSPFPDAGVRLLSPMRGDYLVTVPEWEGRPSSFPEKDGPIPFPEGLGTLIALYRQKVLPTPTSQLEVRSTKHAPRSLTVPDPSGGGRSLWKE